MNKNHKNINQLRSVDPFGMAEKITGRDYKHDKLTESFGIWLHIQKGQEMREELARIGDTQFSSTVADYLKVVVPFGFKVIYIEPFKRENGIHETLYVLFMEELGLFIIFDTFTWDHNKEPGVNGGHLYYNWSPNEEIRFSGLTSSGSYYFPKPRKSHIGLFEKDLITPYFIPDYPEIIQFDRNTHTWEELEALNKPIEATQLLLYKEAILSGKRTIWVGNHDCREGVITTIKTLWENGRFCPIWAECAFPWITHFMDHKKGEGLERHYEATKQRLKHFPSEPLKCINNTYKP